MVHCRTNVTLDMCFLLLEFYVYVFNRGGPLRHYVKTWTEKGFCSFLHVLSMF